MGSSRTVAGRGSGGIRPGSASHTATVAATSTADVRILIATGTPALGAGLAGWLTAAQPGWEVAGVADSPCTIESLLTPDIGLLVASACIDGFMVVATTFRIRADIPVVLLARDDDPQIEADLLRAGALGVLPTTVDRQTLMRTAVDALAGRSTASAGAIRLLVESPEAPPTITTRQRQILEALASGRSTREIADELVLTQSTIKTHIGRLAARLRLSGRQELTQMAPEILVRCAAAQPSGQSAPRPWA